MRELQSGECTILGIPRRGKMLLRLHLKLALSNQETNGKTSAVCLTTNVSLLRIAPNSKFKTL